MTTSTVTRVSLTPRVSGTRQMSRALEKERQIVTARSSLRKQSVLVTVTRETRAPRVWGRLVDVSGVTALGSVSCSQCSPVSMAGVSVATGLTSL